MYKEVALQLDVGTCMEAGGAIEFYLMEQEGSAYPAIETAERCLATFRKLRQ